MKIVVYIVFLLLILSNCESTNNIVENNSTNENYIGIQYFYSNDFKINIGDTFFILKDNFPNNVIQHIFFRTFDIWEDRNNRIIYPEWIQNKILLPKPLIHTAIYEGNEVWLSYSFETLFNNSVFLNMRFNEYNIIIQYFSTSEKIIDSHNDFKGLYIIYYNIYENGEINELNYIMETIKHCLFINFSNYLREENYSDNILIIN